MCKLEPKGSLGLRGEGGEVERSKVKLVEYMLISTNSTLLLLPSLKPNRL